MVSKGISAVFLFAGQRAVICDNRGFPSTRISEHAGDGSLYRGIMICKGCGKEFEAVENNGRKGGKGQRLFCSHSCRNRYFQREYRRTHHDQNLERQTQYYKDHIAERMEYQANYRANDPKETMKRRAMSAVSCAVRYGKILKPDICMNCGTKPKRLEAHHYKGYDHPLKVIWLCTSCHRALEPR